MRLDELVIHNDDLGEKVGDFHGRPIVALRTIEVDFREICDMQQRIRQFFGKPREILSLLPGETIVNQHIVRGTTAEAIGYDKFHEEPLPVGRKVSLDTSGLLATGALVTWRPNNQNIAIIHEEVAE